MRVLTHLQVRIDDGFIKVRGASLLTGYALWDEAGQAVFADPKVEGWFNTEDRGELVGDVLRVFGREGDFVKIGGESVDLARLDSILDAVRGNVDAAVIALPDERHGYLVHLAATKDVAGIVEAFNTRVLPFERIREVHRVDAIPRSPLGKILRSKLADMISRP
jgi:O-succinylbenzoic acid--CoA ligase